MRALTFELEPAGDPIGAVLIYAEPDPEGDGLYRAVAAEEMGYEGIACVDDTARAAVLALGVYERSGSPAALAAARRWLGFVEYMQYPDGSFANFIRNAAGTRNATGATSHRGGHWWSARALWALGRAFRLTGKSEYRERFEACRLAPLVDGKINGLLALARMELYRGQPDEAVKRSIEEACECILETWDGAEYLLDQPGISLIHLWGYHQLQALSEAAMLLDRPEILLPCRKSVQKVIEPAIRDRFWHAFPSKEKQGVCAYDVAPTVLGLAAMHRATGARRYRDLALRGATWLYGRNDAGVAMYDPATGRCRDGINEGRASDNFGAESSVEAGFIELLRRDLEPA